MKRFVMTVLCLMVLTAMLCSITYGQSNSTKNGEKVKFDVLSSDSIKNADIKNSKEDTECSDCNTAISNCAVEPCEWSCYCFSRRGRCGCFRFSRWFYCCYYYSNDGTCNTDDTTTDDTSTDDTTTDDTTTDDKSTDDKSTDDKSTDDKSTDDKSTDDGPIPSLEENLMTFEKLHNKVEYLPLEIKKKNKELLSKLNDYKKIIDRYKKPINNFNPNHTFTAQQLPIFPQIKNNEEFYKDIQKLQKLLKNNKR